jgi:hypothetical protein
MAGDGLVIVSDLKSAIIRFYRNLRQFTGLQIPGPDFSFLDSTHSHTKNDGLA